MVEDGNGNLDKDKVMRELFDYHICLEEVPKVYMAITGNQISKPYTDANYVIEAADNYYQILNHFYSEDYE